MPPANSAEVSSNEGPLRIESMTSRQLIRRAKLIEAVIELVGEVGSEAVQMREVAEHSGVALGTAYRYFRSKDHLLAAALAEWQERLTRRLLAAGRPIEQTPLARVTEYVRRALRAFHRNPEMAALMVRMWSSSDPDVLAIIEQMGRSNSELFKRLMDGIAPDDITYAMFALDAALMSSVTWLVTGRSTLDSAVDRVEGIARMLLRNK
ncbi:TetR family transcriptional regulator [Mycobacterium intracellulare]|uniref:TetR family transcriptional regulator n=1 Tax=Mycobacterium intracellulare TaxID=1767 RepID=UPI000AEA5B47|nr:TetR family transcriptional regulator [Mycobacterium intracellulare]